MAKNLDKSESILIMPVNKEQEEKLSFKQFKIQVENKLKSLGYKVVSSIDDTPDFILSF